MQIQENISLKRFNTFGIDATARYFSSFSSTEELQELLSTFNFQPSVKLILGGGSNILFTKDFNGLILKFAISDCEFAYRKSVLKRKYKDRFVILNVTFRLRKKPIFNTTYGAIEQELDKMAIKELSIQAISQAVINIRSSKLPDPNVI